MFTDPTRIVITPNSLKKIIADDLNRKLCGVEVKVTDVAINEGDDEITIWVEKVAKSK